MCGVSQIFARIRANTTNFGRKIVLASVWIVWIWIRSKLGDPSFSSWVRDGVGSSGLRSWVSVNLLVWETLVVFVGSLQPILKWENLKGYYRETNLFHVKTWLCWILGKTDRLSPDKAVGCLNISNLNKYKRRTLNSSLLLLPCFRSWLDRAVIWAH